VGYSETSKGYRIYVPGQREVELNHDVTFDEDVAMRAKKQMQEIRVIRKMSQ